MSEAFSGSALETKAVSLVKLAAKKSFSKHGGEDWKSVVVVVKGLVSKAKQMELDNSIDKGLAQQRAEQIDVSDGLFDDIITILQGGKNPAKVVKTLKAMLGVK